MIWERLGSPGVYVEPFLGSGAVLLAKPGGPAPREVVCDLNGHLANFYRALRADPDQVAYFADWPTIHQDLTARHRWLLAWGEENGERVSADADWYDPKAAGWWVWGISSWIGHGWCDNPNRDSMPIYTDSGGHGVQQQRTTLPVADQIPNVGAHGKRVQGQGVQIQCRDQMPRCSTENGGQGVQQQRVPDRMPFPQQSGGQGVQAQRDQVPVTPANGNGGGVQVQAVDGEVLTGERLQPWFRALAQRLARVIVLNRSWESAVTPSVLQQTPSLRLVLGMVDVNDPRLQLMQDMTQEKQGLN